MATKIYPQGGAIVLILGDGTRHYINSSAFDWSLNYLNYIVRDKIENQSYDLGILSNIQNEDAVTFTSATQIETYLNNCVNRTISGENPAGVGQVLRDSIGNEGLNSTFGEVIMAHRIPTITAQFQYGIFTGNTNAYEDDFTITKANGGDVVTTDGELILTSSTAANGSAIIESNDYVRYIPGFEMFAYFTGIFTTPTADSQQFIGLYDSQDGFFVGYNGLNFVLGRRKDGNDVLYTLNTTEIGFNPLKYNIFVIKYGYLGVAPIKLAIVRPEGGFIAAKTIEFPNNNTTIHTSNTYLPFRAEVVNSGSVTNKTLKCGSISCGIVDGGGVYPGTRFITKSLSGVVTAAPSQLLAIFRSKTTFKTLANRIKSKLLAISASCEGTKPLSFTIVRNPTILVSGTWADVDTNKSVFEISLNTTCTRAAGREMVSVNLAKSGQSFQDLKDLDISLRPGEWAAIYADSTGASEVNLALRWEEQF